MASVPRPLDRAVRTVLFDAGNTLLLLDFPRIGRILQGLGLTTASTHLARAEMRARHLIDTARTVSKSDDRERWLRYFHAILEGTGIGRRAFLRVYEALEVEHARLNLWSRRAPGALPTLRLLRRRGYRLGVVSNSDGRIESLLAGAGLRPFFEIVVDSAVVGIEKPDPRIFDAALGPLRTAPEEAVYVGDLYHVDIRGAERGGLLPILLDPTGDHRDRPCLKIRDLPELRALLPRSPFV